jgi:hypothetical protein
MKHARDLGTRLDRALSGRERELFIPADSSGAALKETLERSPHGVIFETELKTLANALGKGWGSFKDVLLKGFHNEDVKVRRKEEPTIHIRNPAPSIGVSGTPGAFYDVFSGRDGGLFSRFAFYWLNVEPEWEDQFGSAGESALDEAKSQAAKRLLAFRRRLEDRASPLDLKIKDPAQRMVNDRFDAITERWKREDVRNQLYPDLRRAGLRSVRIGAILGLLRRFERDPNPNRDTVEVGREDVDLGLQIALTYLVHSVRIDGARSSKSGPRLSQIQREYLDALPSGQFETGEAKEIAPNVGVSERNAQRWLDKWSRETGLIDKVKRGVWEKTRASGRPKPSRRLPMPLLGFQAGKLPANSLNSGAMGRQLNKTQAARTQAARPNPRAIACQAKRDARPRWHSSGTGSVASEDGCLYQLGAKNFKMQSPWAESDWKETCLEPDRNLFLPGSPWPAGGIPSADIGALPKREGGALHPSQSAGGPRKNGSHDRDVINDKRHGCYVTGISRKREEGPWLALFHQPAGAPPKIPHRRRLFSLKTPRLPADGPASSQEI